MLAYGEPMVWLTGGALAVAVLMILSLLGLIVWQGIGTFWPVAIVEVVTVDGRALMGQVTRDSEFTLNAASSTTLPPEAAKRARQLLKPMIEAHLAEIEATGEARVAQALRQAIDSTPVDGDYVESLRQLSLAHEGESGDPAIVTAVVTALSRPNISVHRRLLRTANYDLTGEHFYWVSDFEIAKETQPEWAVLLERLEWGQFVGFPQRFLIDGKVVAETPQAAWEAYLKHHVEVRARWRERRGLETHAVGDVNAQIEAARLAVRGAELKHGAESDQVRNAQARFDIVKAEMDAEFARITREIRELNEQNDRFVLVMKSAQGEGKNIGLADVVRAVPANQLGFFARLGVYFDRWWEYLADDPREANTEGGIKPAIFGTALMTMVMSVLVVPVGVLAALYLREYSKGGPVVSAVRIAVNNLAGVPSIVFGVFGLGFFCYLVGGGIDQVFFSAKLPNPTFGTGGLMWASFTLALLTLPVVIVATEEALAAVPSSMREGSYACGGSKWQTIRRIVLPRAMPGIMTGMILAMARGAGEVAPLMLVGAVKLAPELPGQINTIAPYFHVERSFMHLGFHIYDLGFQSPNSEAAKPMVFTTTLLLIALVALLNIAAAWLRARLRRKFAGSQF